MKKTYNLSVKKKIYLFFIFPVWVIVSLFNKRAKSWHEVKSGLSKHEHCFDWLFIQNGRFYYRCSFEGCNELQSVKDPETGENAAL